MFNILFSCIYNLIYKNISLNLISVFVISLFFYLFKLKNKTFLGDSGAQILGLCSYFIKSYNLENAFKCDEIFIIMMLPGIDMFRLF